MKIVIECNEGETPMISNYDELSEAGVSPTLVLGALKQVMNQVEFLEMAKYAKALSESEKTGR